MSSESIADLNARAHAKAERVEVRLLRGHLLRGDASIATLKPAGFLGGTRFDDYRTAVEGAQYDPLARCQTAPVNKVAILLGRLQAAGFALEIEPALASAVQRAEAERARDLEGAARHAARVDGELRMRGLSLYPFQKLGVEWLAKRSGGLLADEMGLGKTIQTIVALPEMAPILVICPALVKGVWKRELAKWRPDLRVTVLAGKDSFRWPEAGEVVITNYDVLPQTLSNHEPLEQTNILSLPSAVRISPGRAHVLPLPVESSCPDFVRLVADEVHMVKGSKAARTIRFRCMTALVRTKGGKTFGLTGTPVLNRAPELWAILSALGIAQEAFGSYKVFETMMGGTKGHFGVEWGPVPDPAAIGARLERVMVRRTRAEVLPQLPGKTYEMVPVEIGKKKATQLDLVLEAFNGVMSRGPGTDFGNGKALPAFSEFSAARAKLAAEKIPAMLGIVEEYETAGEPLIVFSDHRAPIDALSGRDGWAVITGDTSADARTDIEERFQRGEFRGIAATIDAGGVGITLTRAAHALFVDQNPTPALNAQAEDRICRIGQTRGCVIKVLVGDCALDRRIAELLASKRALIESTIEQGRRLAPVVEEMSETEWTALVLGARLESEGDPTEPHGLCPCKEAKRFGPSAALEHWSLAGLRWLAASDPDGAQELNGVGFNKIDGALGHSLARQTERGLTPKQWELAIALCRKYRKQIGEAPESEK